MLKPPEWLSATVKPEYLRNCRVDWKFSGYEGTTSLTVDRDNHVEVAGNTGVAPGSVRAAMDVLARQYVHRIINGSYRVSDASGDILITRDWTRALDCWEDEPDERTLHVRGKAYDHDTEICHDCGTDTDGGIGEHARGEVYALCPECIQDRLDAAADSLV